MPGLLHALKYLALPALASEPPHIYLLSSLTMKLNNNTSLGDKPSIMHSWALASWGNITTRSAYPGGRLKGAAGILVLERVLLVEYPHRCAGAARGWMLPTFNAYALPQTVATGTCTAQYLVSSGAVPAAW
jgi:hypothetical protein